MTIHRMYFILTFPCFPFCRSMYTQNLYYRSWDHVRYLLFYIQYFYCSLFKSQFLYIIFLTGFKKIHEMNHEFQTTKFGWLIDKQLNHSTQSFHIDEYIFSSQQVYLTFLLHSNTYMRYYSGIQLKILFMTISKHYYMMYPKSFSKRVCYSLCNTRKNNV